MKQSAVEWLFENSHIVPKTELNKRKLIEQAKEMEKKQQGYSEEEVKHIVSEALQSALVKFDLEQWFEQFKKK